MHKLPLATAAAVLLAAATADAQGSLSGQGLGYPTGQLSTRALSVGGALAEFDPQSPLNPAALAGWGPGGLYTQYDPEFRTIQAGGREDRTTTARFPIIAAALPMGERWVVGVSASTFLDRTWATSFESTDTLRGQPVLSTESFRSDGAINDLRLAAAFTVRPTFRVGAGVHAFTGEHRVDVARDFRNPGADAGADTGTYGAFEQRSIFSFGGTAYSAGVDWSPVRAVAVAGSARRGGTIQMRVADTLVSRATVPDRYGAAVRYDGITGTTIAARVSWEGWSSLRGLTSPGLPISDALELGVGADAAGPRIGANVMLLRLGVRRRDLPFGVRADPVRQLPEAAEVRETAITAGIGIPLAAGRALVDLGVQRATRTAEARPDARERAWTLSIGLRVRP